MPKSVVAEKSSFYEVVDEETGRKYRIPDLSENVDLIKIVHDAVPNARKYGPEIRIAAAALYTVLGNSYKVGAFLGVDSRIVRHWFHEPWWHIAIREVRKTKNEELDAHLTGLLEETVEELADRVHNGETIVSKDGALTRVPLKARDLATVMGITYDKRALLRGDPTSKVARVDVNEHLEQVAAKLEKLVGHIPNPQIYDGEFEDVNADVEESGTPDVSRGP